jgi:hypothetical protein
MGRYSHAGFTQIIQFATGCFNNFFTCTKQEKVLTRLQQVPAVPAVPTKFLSPFPVMTAVCPSSHWCSNTAIQTRPRTPAA